MDAKASNRSDGAISRHRALPNMSQTTPVLLPSAPHQSGIGCPTTCHDLSSRFPTEPEAAGSGRDACWFSRRLEAATTRQSLPKRVRLHNRERDEPESATILSMCCDGQSCGCYRDLLRVVPSPCAAHTLEQHCRIISQGLAIGDERQGSLSGPIARWLTAVVRICICMIRS